MATVTLRFYGRFVFAEPYDKGSPTGKLNVLALNMQYGGGSFGPHHVLMCVPRRAVHTRLTTVPPTRKALAFGTELQNCEHFVWDLKGCALQVGTDSRFMFKDRGQLPDLGALAAGTVKRIVDPGSLVPGGDSSQVSAVIQIRVGKGNAVAMFKTEYRFVPEGTKEGKDKFLVQADLVEVTIELPPQETALSMTLTTPRTTPARDMVLQRTIAIQVPDRAPELTVVGFTNVCGALPHYVRFDEEFVQNYEVLVGPPHVSLRLIPETSPTGGEAGDCDIPTYLAYDIADNSVIVGKR